MSCDGVRRNLDVLNRGWRGRSSCRRMSRLDARVRQRARLRPQRRARVEAPGYYVLGIACSTRERRTRTQPSSKRALAQTRRALGLARRRESPAEAEAGAGRGWQRSAADVGLRRLALRQQLRDWSQVRHAAFDAANRWIVDRNDGTDHRPWVNLVVLSFSELRQLLGAPRTAPPERHPRGCTHAIVDTSEPRHPRAALDGRRHLPPGLPTRRW